MLLAAERQMPLSSARPRDAAVVTPARYAVRVGRIEMSFVSRRSLLAFSLLAWLAPVATAAAQPKEIRVDWATYNPVSMLLKEKGFLEKEFQKDGIGVRWVQTVSSSNALQFL